MTMNPTRRDALKIIAAGILAPALPVPKPNPTGPIHGPLAPPNFHAPVAHPPSSPLGVAC